VAPTFAPSSPSGVNTEGSILVVLLFVAIIGMLLTYKRGLRDGASKRQAEMPTSLNSAPSYGANNEIMELEFDALDAPLISLYGEIEHQALVPINVNHEEQFTLDKRAILPKVV
jgi:hypothetical protein